MEKFTCGSTNAPQCTQSDRGHHGGGKERRDHPHVRVDIGGNIATSLITNEAVDELGIKKKGSVSVVIQACDITIAVD